MEGNRKGGDNNFETEHEARGRKGATFARFQNWIVAVDIKRKSVDKVDDSRLQATFLKKKKKKIPSTK